MSLVGSTLVVFCKRPKLGQGKQRLAATLGKEAALVLAEHLLACALEDARTWRGPVVLSPSDAEDRGWAQGLAGEWAQVFAQPAGNLGERLQAVDRALREQGNRRILFMGTDAPMLTQAHFASALRVLDDSSVVLSSAADGGVVLMGARSPWPELGALPWSTAALGESLATACQASGLTVGYGAPGYDVDVEDDLRRLSEDLRLDTRPARVALQRQLQAWMNQNNQEKSYA